jgi:hypothetical protein
VVGIRFGSRGAGIEIQSPVRKGIALRFRIWRYLVVEQDDMLTSFGSNLVDSDAGVFQLFVSAFAFPSFYFKVADQTNDVPSRDICT